MSLVGYFSLSYTNTLSALTRPYLGFPGLLCLAGTIALLIKGPDDFTGVHEDRRALTRFKIMHPLDRRIGKNVLAVLLSFNLIVRRRKNWLICPWFFI